MWKFESTIQQLNCDCNDKFTQGEEGGVSVEVENLVTELMENLDQFVLDPAPQVVLLTI